jgi:hypothetical protein
MSKFFDIFGFLQQTFYAELTDYGCDLLSEA